jgi:hypothetical protein
MPPVVQRNVTVNGLNVGVNNGSVKYQQPNFDKLGKNITQKRNLDEGNAENILDFCAKQVSENPSKRNRYIVIVITIASFQK